MAPSAAPTFYRTQKEGGAVDWVWNQGLLYYDAWVMPKGAPHRANALKFIEFTLRPDVQADFTQKYPGSPVVAAANELLPKDVRAASVSEPANMSQVITPDLAWWTKPDANGKTNVDRVYEKWTTWIL
jgi:putative spermidine/putrescine transport system substrate-binding protein